MKYFKLYVLLLAGVFLTGCFGQSKLPMVYEEDSSYRNQLVKYMPADYGDISMGFISEELCVVPLDYQVSKHPAITAESSLIFDITDRKVLYADNVYEKLYPASVTKILTALIVLEQCENLSETVTISYNAANITESGAKKCGFKEGDQILLRDLLYSFLVFSGNDAGIALAEYVSGSESAFVDLMNQKARDLGAFNSHFVNAHGLHSDDHYTTVYDMYLIFNECIKNEMFVDMIKTNRYVAAYKTAEGEAKQRVFENTNRYLLGTEIPPKGVTVIGGKTGTTLKAGACLVLYSIDEDNHEHISIVFNAPTSDALFEQMTTLLNYE